ncbi:MULTISPECIES: AraC family transcriptional regulator [unclassified Arcicella]|uniref:helix-turn-helix domain-containing protein n=1 Tax=unclassified Arcicella TaxID=2644986 RepID=UPI00285FC476|nr:MULTISPECIES: AraC family transcriptional regulator [unclassified Arcicella]MDR6562027.1 AraC-like DNA-binding protein [Arcicella sp. BE51]MDR6811899.1 AraC-like DNA-binding protein [Arcicella sp. BE140]MDR6822929.1 AraC-like DNA-binding protein [Arcicella sp. BE139]
MSQFILYQGKAKELSYFPYIIEFANYKIQNIQLNSQEIKTNEGIRICLIIDGKFDWVIDGQPYLLYPNDVSLTCPWQSSGSSKGAYDIGALMWITIKPSHFEANGELVLGEWSSISETDQRVIGKILTLNKKPVLTRLKACQQIFQNIESELFSKELGYRTRVNHLIDELLITAVRHLSKQDNLRRDFPQTFLKLEQTLRENLSHSWSVEEMAGLVGLGTTAFSEKVKAFSGFSPLNYLINIRISEAIKLLSRKDLSLTDIALETGFYSSQHFSSTFKKLTGYTPREFRKNTD